MPATLSYPGVYIEELSSGVHTITGVATSITAFVGWAWKGPLNEPTRITSFADYERVFGGLWGPSTMSYAVQQFFLNGGSEALIVRVATSSAHPAVFILGGMTLEAASPGTWANDLQIIIEDKTHTKDTSDAQLFNLIVRDDPQTKKDGDKRGGSGATETFRNVSSDPNSSRFVQTILAQQSNLLRFKSNGAGDPAPPANTPATPYVFDSTAANLANDGLAPTILLAVGPINGSSANKTGLFALQKADLFNLLCIPPLIAVSATGAVSEADVDMSIWTAASKICKDRRAFLLIDAPSNWAPDNVLSTGSPTLSILSGNVERNNAAIYFPRLRMADPLQENNLADFAPCGVVAGIISRTDAARGVWKAPAGLEASTLGVTGLSVKGLPATLNDADSGALNPLGINCIRSFPVTGHAVWGARTVAGADALASEWKYVPVRRTALFIEESLYRGTQWVVFEPNDEPLWAQIRLNLGAFMHNLFRQGAFQGTTPKEAYFVKCDKETTTQTDINSGIVNILVGFAPLKPAEFVVIKIQQLAGQIET
ncbi:MAG TPA: phage tail sheath C-terminal domain-containing protein [Chthoniobacterales bacterium]|nr:phage tail sheath C-terminal domain-containing protein [Chthoniobacterales bacterium]